MRGLLGACVAALLLVSGCGDPVDKAAKARIFSAEDPPKAVASAAQKLPPQDVASDPHVAERILGMGAAEATERLGPHKYTAMVSFEWTGGPPPSTTVGGLGVSNAVKLTENRTLVAGAGGVAGDFHATVENSREQGLDVLRVHGDVYARSKYGKFRQRLRDRGMAERTREDTFGALRDVESLFQNRIALKPQGTSQFAGRTAWNYAVSLAPAGEASDALELPPPARPKNGIDPASARRVAFQQHREPTSLSGEVLVDAETSVVLKARIDGRMVVPGQPGEKPAQLRLVLDQSLSDIGKDPHFAPPKDFLPDQDKPAGIADALDRFGVPRGSMVDGGTPVIKPKAGAQTPADDDSNDDTQ